MKAITDSTGLTLRNLTRTGNYCTAIFHAPDDLGELMAYTTYAARIAKFGAEMRRFGVDLEHGTIEIVFTAPAESEQPIPPQPGRRRYPKFPQKVITSP